MVAFLLTVATTNHFLWWDFPNFVMQLSDQVGITGPGHWAASANPQAFHTDILARFGVGWVLLILAAAFGVHGLATGRPHAWVFLLCPLISSWFTTKRPSQFPRWVFPLLPFVAVAGASALVATRRQVRKWPRGQTAHPAPSCARRRSPWSVWLPLVSRCGWGRSRRVSD